MNTRVVLLVSSPRRGEIDSQRHSSIHATLIKPVTTRSLRVAVSKALEDVKADGGMSVPKNTKFPPMRTLNILVAEDNAVNQRLVKLNLEQWGHKVAVANDGDEAVKVFNSRSFDLVLTDLQMPKMSGFEAAVEIRRIEKIKSLNRTPILALSANVIKGVRDECTKSGMDGYVSKPVRQQELLSVMSGLIPDLFLDSPPSADNVAGRTSSTKGTVPEGLPPGVSVPAIIPAGPAQPPLSTTFDAEALMSNICGDMGILAEVVKLCRDGDAPRLLKDLAESISKGDTEAVAKAAHGLKGMVGAFNATNAWADAKNLEYSAKQGNADVLLTEADSFVQSLRALIDELETFAGIEHQHVSWI